MFQSDCVILKPAKFPIAIMSKGGKVGGWGGWEGVLAKSCFDCWTTLVWLIGFCFPGDRQKTIGFQDDFGGMVVN